MEKLDRELSLKIAKQCTFFHVKKIDRIIYGFYDKIMSNAEISPHQFSLLNSIFLAQKRVTVSEFAKIIAMDRTTLTRNLNLLEKNGFIKIEKELKDSRKKVFFLTKKGENTLMHNFSFWQEAQNKFIQKVGEESWDKLMHAISIIENLQKELSDM